eukprot:12399529-Karenia_brevis.AAC.1
MGVPSVWAWDGMIQAVIAKKEEVLPSQQLLILEKSVKMWTWELVLEEMPHFKVTKQFKKENKKIEVSCPAVVALAEVAVQDVKKDLLRPAE